MEKFMSEYLVRRAKYGYEVAKFEESSYPIDVYSISGSRCFCPARTRSCKHMKIFKAWERNGSQPGEVYDDTAKIINRLI